MTHSSGQTLNKMVLQKVQRREQTNKNVREKADEPQNRGNSTNFDWILNINPPIGVSEKKHYTILLASIKSKAFFNHN